MESRGKKIDLTLNLYCGKHGYVFPADQDEITHRFTLNRILPMIRVIDFHAFSQALGASLLLVLGGS